MPQVSIVLPYFNAAQTLEEAIDSILAQTYKDWDLWLINNNSDDASLRIAEVRAAQDPRIQLLEEPRQGVAVAMNTGFRYAQGNFIARMDADDLAQPTRIAKQVAHLQGDTSLDVSCSQVEFVSQLERSKGRMHFVEWQNRILSPEEHFLKRFVDAPLAQPTVMFRRSLPIEFGNYSEEALPEDFELWLRWMHQGVRFEKLPEMLLVERDSLGRLTRTHANYSTKAFDRTKCHWLANWLKREHPGRGVLVLGTSSLCQQRAALLKAESVEIHSYSDVKKKVISGHRFISHTELKPGLEPFIVSFISQRGTGDRIAEFLSMQGLVEGQDFLLAA